MRHSGTRRGITRFITIYLIFYGMALGWLGPGWLWASEMDSRLARSGVLVADGVAWIPIGGCDLACSGRRDGLDRNRGVRSGGS